MTLASSTRSEHRSRLALYLPTILLALLVLVVREAVGKDPPGHASFQSISLCDGDGRVRARLAVQADGAVLLSAMDGAGRVRLRLGTHANGEPGFSLLDAGGGSRLALALTETEEPAMVLRDSKRTDRLVAALTNESAPFVTLSDSKGHSRAAFGVAADDLPALELLDAGERLVGTLRSNANGANLLELAAPGGDTVVLSASDADLCGLAVRDAGGQRKLRAGLFDARQQFGLELEDASVQASMGIGEGAFVQLGTRDGKSRIYLRGGSPQSTGMVLSDAEGHWRARLAVSEGRSSLGLGDSNQQNRVQADADENGGRLVVTDREGKTVWRSGE